MLHLEVVWPHEEVCNAGTHDAQNPLIKVLGLGLGGRIRQLGLGHAAETPDLHSRAAWASSQMRT